MLYEIIFLDAFNQLEISEQDWTWLCRAEECVRVRT
jgi:hypothetical protein